MCGIAGFCHADENWEKNILEMNKRMYHRGPDAGGVWKEDDGTIVLGHRRLSIIDLTENGKQPMLSHSERFAIAYNGEIYNHKELAEKLLKDGYVSSFRGTSDTEILLEGFEAYGVKKTLEFVKGMFAIALYDRKDKKLILVRDRVGEKPLYYGKLGERFIFASEIGVVAAYEGFKAEINKDILITYFTHGYIPAPHTIYKGFYKLMPGTFLELDCKTGEYEFHTYWSMSDVAIMGQNNLFRGTEEEATEELERLLKDAIKGQMQADVPVGAFLSAGIDSSTVVSLMQEINPGKVKSFTIGMPVKEYNEAEVAKEIAKHLGTEHTELYITEEDAKQVIPKLGYMFGEPFADSSQIPTYLVSKMTREHVTVSLSGDAGDELFCGYGSYVSIDRIWNKMCKIPYVVRKPVSVVAYHNPIIRNQILLNKAKLLGAIDPMELYDFAQDQDGFASRIPLDKGIKFEKDIPSNMELNHRIMLRDMEMYHPDDILVKVDRTAMAVSLETRVPMLDRDVVEFAWTLPIEYKRSDGVSKRVLRNALYKRVPKELMDRPKKGFSIPITKWLKEEGLRKWAEELLNPDIISRQGILDEKIVSKLWRDFIEKDNWRIQIWYILMFQVWINENEKLLINTVDLQ